MQCKIAIGCAYERSRWEVRASNGDYSALRPYNDFDTSAIQQMLIAKPNKSPTFTIVKNLLVTAVIGWLLFVLLILR